MGLHVEEAYDLGGGDAAPEGLPYRLPRYHRHTQVGKPATSSFPTSVVDPE